MANKEQVDYALELAEGGYEVFPCRGKFPALKGSWKELATSNPKNIRQLWEEAPDADIAIKAGNGLIVIDFDDPECEAAQWLEPRLPETLTCKTGRGVHRYYYCERSDALKNLQLKGVDVKTDGGYIIGPGSLHKTGVRYKWVNPGAEWTELPEEVFEYLLKAGKKKVRSPLRERKVGDKVGEGERHQFLLQESWRLVCRKGLGYDELLAVVRETLLPQCENPESISEYEIEEICKGAIAKRNSFAVTLNELTEAGLADKFVEYYGDSVVAVDGDQWFKFNETTGLWDRIEGPFNLTLPVRDAVFHAVTSTSGDPDVNKAATNWYKNSGGFNYLSNVTKFVAPRIKVDEQDFLIPDGHLPFRNGMYDMKTGEFRGFQPTDYVRETVRADFNPDAECPKWLETVTYLTKGDLGCIRYLQQIMGFLLSSDTMRGVFYFVGVPNSGKNTLVCTLNDILGTTLASTASKALIHVSKNDDDEQQARRHLTMVGKRFVWIDETRNEDVVDPQKFKSIASTDTWLRARKLRHDAFEFQNKAKVVVMSNFQPRIDPDDDAAWSRVIYVPFLQKIPDDVRRPDFMQEVKQEADGILAWCVAGYADYLAMGQRFTVPDVVESQIKMWQEDSTPLLEFVQTNCDVGPEYECTGAMLYGEYEQWRSIRCLGELGHFSNAPALVKSLFRLLGDQIERGRTKNERFIRGIAPRGTIKVDG